MSEAEDLVERWQSADPFARALIQHAKYGLEKAIAYALAAKDDEIARLKAEVERLKADWQEANDHVRRLLGER